LDVQLFVDCSTAACRTDASYDDRMTAVLRERSLKPTINTVAELRTAIEDVAGDKFKLEILGGLLIVSPLPINLHNLTVMAIRDELILVCKPSGLAVSERTELIVNDDNKLQPDLTVMRRADLKPTLKATEYPADKALLAVEVTSPSNGEDDRRWGKKYKAYAKGMVPIYLLIDAYDERGPMVSLFSQPSGTRYQAETVVPFKTRLPLPEPFPMVLDLSEFSGSAGDEG
jgi:Uma2 family endonuclease